MSMQTNLAQSEVRVTDEERVSAAERRNLAEKSERYVAPQLRRFSLHSATGFFPTSMTGNS